MHHNDINWFYYRGKWGPNKKRDEEKEERDSLAKGGKNVGNKWDSLLHFSGLLGLFDK